MLFYPHRVQMNQRFVKFSHKLDKLEVILSVAYNSGRSSWSNKTPNQERYRVEKNNHQNNAQQDASYYVKQNTKKLCHK